MEETKNTPKPTIEERIKRAAEKAGDTLSDVASELKGSAQELYDKAAPKAIELCDDVKKDTDLLIDKAKNTIESLKKK